MQSVSSFSGCTKGLHTLTEVFPVGAFVALKLHSPLPFQSRLEKKIRKYQNPAISIDGVYAQFSYSKPLSDSAKNFEVVAKVAKDAFLNSALSRLKCGDPVNLGLPSTNPDKWLLGGIPSGTVKLRSIKIADGHQFTKKLVFECPGRMFDSIRKSDYIGLNSSAFMVKDVSRKDGCARFTIEVGKNSREKTIFGLEDLQTGALFNLSLPFVRVDPPHTMR